MLFRSGLMGANYCEDGHRYTGDFCDRCHPSVGVEDRLDELTNELRETNKLLRELLLKDSG